MSQRAHPWRELALRLARQFDADLSNVFAVFAPASRSFYVMAGTTEYYASHEQLRAELRSAP
ncbi:hypothetical protein [Paraburkholderia sp. BL27I4N3]|uniref:hypothetical protein n=1 Tax=Paraburkholderia sp. BL27I4N3 TaxID=1938805 RepID=UPI000E255130|nr:hypothetical protein [Paraburkholderia sp. BL27I4N3]